MIIKNPNFISDQMTAREICMAFGLKHKGDIISLIGEGLIKKYYQYYKPTEKLLQELVPIDIEIIDAERLNGYNLFYIKNISEIFECDRTIAKVILSKYFTRTDFGYYRRSNNLDNLLADGEIKLKLKEDKENDKG